MSQHNMMPMDYERKRKYGIMPAQYDEMIRAQGGRCCICGRLLSNPCIDHDHQTGKVRGILCTQCNTGLGMFRDEIALLARAIVYLEDHSLSESTEQDPEA